MESLIEFTETVLALASGSCTQCLIEELGNENSQIVGTIGRFQVAYEWRNPSPASEEEFADAFAEFLTRVVKMAVFTGELMRRPGVRWIDESREIALPVIASPN